MKKIIISVKNLVKTYVSKGVETQAVRGISFDINEGEFVALAGPSGSGKSTILYQLSLLDNPTSGEIKFEGKNILKLTDKQKTWFRLNEIGYVFQHYELLPELNALENVALPMRVMVKKEESFRKARKFLKSIGLGERENHYPEELSGGEQQRVSIARALINMPKVIFADEPTANLDSVASKKIIETLKFLSRKYKKTILVVNHEKSFEKYFDRIIRIKDGKLVEIDNKKLKKK